MKSKTIPAARRLLRPVAAAALAVITATLALVAHSAENGAAAGADGMKPETRESGTAAESDALREARELVKESLTRTQKSRLLALLNEGAPDELATVKGLGATRIRAIEAARPLENVESLVEVRGIGMATFAGILAHAETLTGRGRTASPQAEAADPASTPQRETRADEMPAPGDAKKTPSSRKESTSPSRKKTSPSREKPSSSRAHPGDRSEDAPNREGPDQRSSGRRATIARTA